MKKYFAIIIGTGGGAKLRPLADKGHKIAIIEKADPGGTCLNRGCIPSKMLIHAADVARTIREADRFNLTATEPEVDFPALVKRVNDFVSSQSAAIVKMYEGHPNIDFYQHEAHFVDDKVIEAGGEELTAEHIFIAVGARPKMPPIDGLAETPYMTSTEALKAERLPEQLIIIGGGYIAAELGHFFGGLGSQVDLIARTCLVKQADADIAAEFSRVFGAHYHLHQGYTPRQVNYKKGTFTVLSHNQAGEELKLTGDALLVATGVNPNSDTLRLENTNIQTDDRGYIKVNEYLETNVDGVYALGDVVGNYLFRHIVNREGEYLLNRVTNPEAPEPMDYGAVPYAVFSDPQVAGVGLTEAEVKATGIDCFVGINKYENSAMGDALRSDHGLVKLIFDRESHCLIGGHIVGPEASNMIHMMIAYIKMEATLEDMLDTTYIHPALPENIRNAARKAKEALDS